MDHSNKSEKSIISDETNLLIDLAWDDKVSFKDIEHRLGITEAEVKATMKRVLKPRSYILWRERIKKYKKARR